MTVIFRIIQIDDLTKPDMLYKNQISCTTKIKFTLNQKISQEIVNSTRT